MNHIIKLYNLFLNTTRSLESAMLLAVRLFMANVFWSAGLTKIQDMETTIALFEYEYAVPVVSPVFAAYSATAVELLVPILLVFGLATRAAAVPLLVMTAVIQFTYLDHVQHIGWAMMLGTLLFVGAGKWSVDHWVAKRHSERSEEL